MITDNLLRAVYHNYDAYDINVTSIKMPNQLNDSKVNAAYVKMAVNTMSMGNSFSDFIERYNILIEQGRNAFYKTYGMRGYEKYCHNNEVNEFICKINQPEIERETGNKKTNTFDFIRIRIGIPTKQSNGSRKEFIQQNMEDIVQVVLHKISESKKYQRYGIPVNYLKLSHATITSQSELELVFELKGNMLTPFYK